ncbi:hypothetical protein CDO52_04535 [Nocardiopsis gilva YIM 90087]|uniref:Uncharacterized protein n=1 Tax=Nocardiopsis gilva YIM 90087 TaxID=1235441 RepID=A0A223S1Z5_9ACTN|nr:hypothetical protein [Nocardiopsis gilva]ASU82146.1 hypothetical protein CDO52_04535 [Nocardiopsis gilva YIM 90087]
MLSGKDGRTRRASLRVVAALPLGTVFIGSTLVALVPSASADTLALHTELRPMISLAPERLTIETGDTATLDLKVEPSPDRPNIQFCLYDQRVDNDFGIGDHEARTAPATAKVTGTPTESVTVTAMVDYVATNKGIDCALVDEVPRDTAASAPVEVEVVAEEEPDPPETEEPSPPDETDPPDESDPPETEDPTAPPETEDPSEPPATEDPSDPPETGDPSDPPDKSGSPEATPPKTTPPEKTPPKKKPSSPSTEKPSTKEPATRSPRQNTSAPRPAPPHSPVTTRSPDSGSDAADGRPSLPTGPADIPELDTPSSSEDLADLPTVEPGEDEKDSTTVAAGDTDVSSSITPLVMFAFLLLLLFLSVPLSPFRRVRTGTGYMGRRRKG